MKSKFCILLLVVFFLKFESVYAQQRNVGLVVKMNGYLVNLGGQILFQPCEDTAVNFWNSLDNTSFELKSFKDNMYFDAIKNIGDSVDVYFYDYIDQKEYFTHLYFFYCSVEVDLLLLDKTSFKVCQNPRYDISFQGKRYPLLGFVVDNRLKKIIPYDIKNLRKLYNFYWDRGYTVPRWLDQYIDSMMKR